MISYNNILYKYLIRNDTNFCLFQFGEKNEFLRIRIRIRVIDINIRFIIEIFNFIQIFRID